MKSSRRHHDPTPGDDVLRDAPPPARRLAPAGAALATLLLLSSPSAAQELYVAAGQGLYGSDALCLEPESLLSSYRVGVSGSSFGASASYEDEDWPWPEPPPGSTGGGNQAIGFVPALAGSVAGRAFQEEVALRHGGAFQIVGELQPLGLLGLDDSRLTRFFRPFVGAGVHVAQDGEPGTGGPGGVPIYGIRGRTDPIATVGTSLIARPVGLPFGIQVQYRVTWLFGGDFEFETPEGEVIRSEGSETLVWGELTAGITIDLGG